MDNSESLPQRIEVRANQHYPYPENETVELVFVNIEFGLRVGFEGVRVWVKTSGDLGLVLYTVVSDV